MVRILIVEDNPASTLLLVTLFRAVLRFRNLDVLGNVNGPGGTDLAPAGGPR